LHSPSIHKEHDSRTVQSCNNTFCRALRVKLSVLLASTRTRCKVPHAQHPSGKNPLLKRSPGTPVLKWISHILPSKAPIQRTFLVPTLLLLLLPTAKMFFEILDARSRNDDRAAQSASHSGGSSLEATEQRAKQTLIKVRARDTTYSVICSSSKSSRSLLRALQQYRRQETFV
jgi:hypothetical protein